MERIGQCIMTCPTTAAFNGMDLTKRKLNVGSSLRYFGDGFQKKAMVGGRKCWKIPVMEGNLIVVGPYEMLRIEHTAFSRNVFAQGAVYAAEWLSKQNEPKVFSMADVLGLS
jgi:formylmethanofuran:tetrahydromethanopterin formyltransferase